MDDARQKHNIALGVLNPSLPWRCVIYNKLSVIVQISLVVGGLFLTMYAANTAFKYYKYHQQKQKDELFYMVERITDTLQGTASENDDHENNFMVINHVRDMIIRIKDRPRKFVSEFGENFFTVASLQVWRRFGRKR